MTPWGHWITIIANKGLVFSNKVNGTKSVASVSCMCNVALAIDLPMVPLAFLWPLILTYGDDRIKGHPHNKFSIYMYKKLCMYTRYPPTTDLFAKQRNLIKETSE